MSDVEVVGPHEGHNQPGTSQSYALDVKGPVSFSVGVVLRLRLRHLPAVVFSSGLCSKRVRVLEREADQAGRELRGAVTDMVGGDWADKEMGEGGRGLEMRGVVGVVGVVGGGVRDQRQGVPGTGKRGRRRGIQEMMLEVRS